MRFLTSPTSHVWQHRSEQIFPNKLFTVWTIALVIAFAKAAIGQTEQAVLATVNGVVITQKEVDDSVASRILPVQQQLYALRKVALDNLVIKQLLEGEAKKGK